jgi:hypothetical protein
VLLTGWSCCGCCCSQAVAGQGALGTACNQVHVLLAGRGDAAATLGACNAAHTYSKDHMSAHWKYVTMSCNQVLKHRKNVMTMSCVWQARVPCRSHSQHVQASFCPECWQLRSNKPPMNAATHFPKLQVLLGLQSHPVLQTARRRSSY